MKFVGQLNIMTELYYVLQDLWLDKSRSANFLFRGPSGYGKTTMALSAAKYLAGNSFEIYWADYTEFKFKKRVIFVDEVHRVKDHESLYGHMDNGLHVFLFATNHDGVLPEAFSNRCSQFVFEEYSTDDLVYIAKSYAQEYHQFTAKEEDWVAVVDAGNRNPRIIKKLVDKLGAYLRVSRQKPEAVDFPATIRDVFNIKDGLDTLCREYLELLDSVGGHASLSVIKTMLHVDEATLRNDVEPILLRRKKIQITSKGRTLYNASI